MPLASNTFGSTIPHPRISTQPVPLQNGQPFSAANITTDIHFGTWFGKREIGRTQTDLSIFAEHFFGKQQQYLLQISE